MRNHWRYFYTNICLLFVKKCDILCHMGKERGKYVNSNTDTNSENGRSRSKAKGRITNNRR